MTYVKKKDIYEKYGVKEIYHNRSRQENADLYILKDGAYVLNQKGSKTESLNSVLLVGFSIELSRLFK